MWPVITLIVSFICVTIRADVVHFLPPPVLLEPPSVAFSGLNYLSDSELQSQWSSNGLGQPVQETTTQRFSLPEIIINKSAREGSPSGEVANHNGDSIVVHNQYLPPTPNPTTTTTTSTTTQRPLQDEPNYYLPPTSSSSSDRNPNNGRNLYYYYPKPPIQFDEPFVEPTYLPPPQPPLILPPPALPTPPLNSYLPPPSTNVLTRTALNPSDNDFFFVGGGARASPLRLELTEMKCLSNGDDGYFRTRITVQSFIDTRPVFEDILATTCDHRLEIQRNQIVINIPASEFATCGVVNCGNGQRNDELCARIRFPQIRGMRTINDAILALQCKPQERVVSRTHALRMGVSNDR